MIEDLWSDLLESLDEAVSRRIGSAWPARDRALAALDVAKSDQAARADDPFGAAAADLARFCGLDATDLRLLTVAAAAEADPTIHLLTGLLSGDDGPGRPTVALALELAGLAALSATARSRLGDNGPLIRAGLMVVEGTGVLPVRRCRVPDRVAAELLGDHQPPGDLLPLLFEPVPVPVVGTDMVAGALTAGHRLVWVYSPPGAAGVALAAAACGALDIPCLAADLRLLPMAPGPAELTVAAPDPAAVATAVRALVLEAALTGTVLLLAGAELAGPVVALLESAPLPVVAIATGGWNNRWSTSLPITLTAPRLSTVERAEIWRPLLGADPGREIAALRLTPEQIGIVGRHATAAAELAGESGLTVERIRGSVRQLGRGQHRGSTEVPAGLDDLVLPDRTRDEILRLLDWARYRDDVLSQGPLQGKGGKGTGICALFSGGPGTGKTLAAHIIADTLGMDLYAVELAAVVSKYIGETEKNLELVFAEAESMNAVLFFDEADALFGSRSEIKDSRDRYANTEIAYLLQRMEAFDGITVLATNLRGNLDPAFARRLHFIVHFPDPDAPTRRRLWRLHLEAVGELDPADPVNVELLAGAVEVSGGDIRNIVLAAAYAARGEDATVGMRHLTDAVGREYTKLGRRAPVGIG